MATCEEALKKQLYHLVEVLRVSVLYPVFANEAMDEAAGDTWWVCRVGREIEV